MRSLANAVTRSPPGLSRNTDRNSGKAPDEPRQGRLPRSLVPIGPGLNLCLSGCDARGGYLVGSMMCCRPLTHLWGAYSPSSSKPGQDLFIAAIAIVHRLPIATLDTRDFERIQDFSHYQASTILRLILESWLLGRTILGKPILHEVSIVRLDLRQINFDRTRVGGGPVAQLVRAVGS